MTSKKFTFVEAFVPNAFVFDFGAVHKQRYLAAPARGKTSLALVRLRTKWRSFRNCVVEHREAGMWTWKETLHNVRPLESIAGTQFASCSVRTAQRVCCT